MISVQLNLANSAFDDCASREAADIFKKYAGWVAGKSQGELENTGHPLHDTNGNVVGSVECDDLGNDAFVGEAAGPELSRIFTALAEKVGSMDCDREKLEGEQFKLRDLNGNTVGSATMKSIERSMSM